MALKMNNRQAFLKQTASLSAGSMMALPQLQAFASANVSKRIKRSLRVAHLTDVHLLKKPGPKMSLAECCHRLTP